MKLSERVKYLTHLSGFSFSVPVMSSLCIFNSLRFVVTISYCSFIGPISFLN